MCEVTGAGERKAYSRSTEKFSTTGRQGVCGKEWMKRGCETNRARSYKAWRAKLEIWTLSEGFNGGTEVHFTYLLRYLLTRTKHTLLAQKSSHNGAQQAETYICSQRISVAYKCCSFSVL